MYRKHNFLIVAAFMLTQFTTAQTTQDAKMKSFIDVLMKKMTLDEKIGQLNLPGAGDITTGQAGSSDIGKKISEGNVGGLFNIKLFFRSHWLYHVVGICRL